MVREIPTGVKVIAVLLLITGPLNMINAIIFYAAIPALVIFQILQGILIIAVGISLMQGRNWARTTAIVLSFVTIIFGTLAMMSGQVHNIVNILLNLGIVIYLVANKSVIRSFSNEDDDFVNEYYEYDDYYEETEELEEYDEDGFAEVFPGEDDDEGFTEIFPGENDDEGFTEIIQDDEENGEGLSDSGTRKLVFRVKGG